MAACQSAVKTRQPSKSGGFAADQTLGQIAPAESFARPSVRCMDSGGLAWPMMARIDGRAVKLLTLLSNGAMTLACSRCGQIAEPAASPAQADRVVQVSEHPCPEPRIEEQPRQVKQVEPLRRASVSKPMWASWPVRGPQ